VRVLEVALLLLCCAVVAQTVLLVRTGRGPDPAEHPGPAGADPAEHPDGTRPEATERGAERPPEGAPPPGGGPPPTVRIAETVDELLPDGIMRNRSRQLRMMEHVDSGITARDLDAIQRESNDAVEQFAVDHELGPRLTQVTTGVIEEYLWSLNGSKMLMATGLRDDTTIAEGIARERDRSRRTLAALLGQDLGDQLEPVIFDIWDQRWRELEQRQPGAMPLPNHAPTDPDGSFSGSPGSPPRTSPPAPSTP
jgi:hypothetical protein